MEKEFQKYLEQLKKEFPNFNVQLGMAHYDDDRPNPWWICLQGNKVVCKCCGKGGGRYEIDEYNHATFAEALESIREQLKVKEGGEV